MALQDVTLDNIQGGQLLDQFQTELQRAHDALLDKRRDGVASITINIKVKRRMENNNIIPYMDLEHSVALKLPGFKQSGIVISSDGKLQSESTSRDASQPGLFNLEGDQVNGR